ncbi:MAG: DUF4178 domain-containing protein [Campylobacterota bacterium]|nr:DUF4178 domain-containing protein [Campylobacterota bacterium]
MLSKVQQKRREYIAGLNQLIPLSKQHQYTIKDLKKGSYLSIGKENFTVLSTSTYLETKWENFKKKKNDYYITELELFCIGSGEVRYIEWEEDDEIEAYITTGVLALKSLKHQNKPVTKKTLDNIAENEEGILTVNGVEYHYDDEDTFSALYNSDKHTDIPVRVFEFYCDNAKSLSVEFWYDDNDDIKPEKEAFFSEELNLTTLTVLQL